MSLFDKISSGEHEEVVWDKNGLLFRKWNDETGDYFPEQMRIINKTISFTTDNWKTVRTVIGEYHYADPKTGKIIETYGINAETIIGKLILGEELIITNSNGSMEFNDSGLVIDTMSNGGFGFQIKKNGTSVLYADTNGNLVLKGYIYAEGGTFKGRVEASEGFFNGTVNATDGVFNGTVNATDGVFNGTVNAKNGTFNGTVNATGGNFSGNIQANDCTFNNGTFNNGLFKGDVEAKSFSVSKLANDDISDFSNIVEYKIGMDDAFQVFGNGLYMGVVFPVDGENGGINYYIGSAIVFSTDKEQSIDYRGNATIYGSSIHLEGDTIVNSILTVNDNALFKRNVEISDSLIVHGSKSRIVNTDDGVFSLHAYETATPYFGDIGIGTINSDGFDVVPINYIFGETVNTNVEYSVFLQKEGQGDLWVDTKDPLFFIVKGTPGLKYSWELKAVQRDYECVELNEYSSELSLSSNDSEDTEVTNILDDIVRSLDQEEEWIN